MQFLIILFIFFIFAIRIFLWYYNTAKKKGQRGEMRIAKELAKLPQEYVTINNVILQTPKGTTQIDHIVVSPYAIFVIETKNYSGEIYGSDSKDEWKQIIKTDVRYKKKWYKTYTYITKNTFYNPARQSIGHTIPIKKLIEHNYDLPIIPIVVFVGNADLTNVHTNTIVLKRDYLLSAIQNYHLTPYLSETDVTDIVSIINRNNLCDKVSNKKHIKNVKEVQKNKRTLTISGVCPRCGGELVKRNGQYGSFYGCSNYPKCKFTTNC